VGVLTYQLNDAAKSSFTGHVITTPLGPPLTNNRIYLLDKHQMLMPEGGRGELYVSGANVTRGYLNRAALTAERFVPDPFSAVLGARMYRTGDVARHLADGNIEFLGRADDQVKIRGFRVELGEIAAVVQKHPSVQQATVLARGDACADKQLVAYVIAKPLSPIITRELQAFVRKQLPEYMVPAQFIKLEEFPHTPQGKIDRRALLSRQSPFEPGESNAQRRGYVAPRDNTETYLAVMWQEILGTTEFGVKDNFFDLGGHSLKAVILAARIEKAYQKRVAVRTVFEKPTIEEMAAYIRQTITFSPPTPVVPIQPRGNSLPLFCVHAATGLVDCWLPLARYLGIKQPLFAFQSCGFEGEQDPLERIEDMAALYIKDMRSIQPRGPYQLGGWCLGGTIAYEMAQQLIAAGEHVSLLALFDATPYAKSGFTPVTEPIQEQELLEEAKKTIQWNLRRMNMSAEQLLTLEFEALLDLFLSSSKEYGLIPEDVAMQQCRRLVKVWAINSAARKRYRYRPLPVPIALLRNASSHDTGNAYGWDQLAQGGLEIHKFSAGHADFLNETNAQLLADTLGHLFAGQQALTWSMPC
jgi:thioesterase domain-containing protein